MVAPIAFAPGRVNLIGEHTDYTGGLVLPFALDVGVTVRGERGGDTIHLRSDDEPEPVALTLDGEPLDGAELAPWGTYVAEAVKQLRPTVGFVGTVSSTMPRGGTGLSTSSALTCSVLLALGAEGDALTIASMAQRAEIAATGVNIGLMDQIASMCGVDGHAVRIDCRSFDVETVTIPDHVDILVVHSGQPRLLVDSEYNNRRIACQMIEDQIGPLRDRTLDDVRSLTDPVLRKRATHVIAENERVDQMVLALRSGDVAQMADLLRQGHRSLAELFETSTPIVDAMVDTLEATPGVHAARMTGGGFGGCIVALAEPGVALETPTWWMRAKAGPGASVRSSPVR
ncbi:MAG: galactokinase family protein [Acidimicrobiales bacterium]